MQGGRRGLIPSRTVAVHNEDGVPCASMTDQYQRWRRHFALQHRAWLHRYDFHGEATVFMSPLKKRQSLQETSNSAT